MQSIACDVAILGAGPAGSAAAIELARAGRRVLVIEKRLFPREKACGGCLSPGAVARLRKLLDNDYDLPGVPGRRITFTMGRYRVSCEPRGTSWMAERSRLDAALADAASSAGAELWFGKPASLQRGNTCWDVMVGSCRVIANRVLVATGLGRSFEVMQIMGRKTHPPMIAQAWLQPSRDALAVGEVELHWLRGGYIGLARPQEGVWVIALAIEASELVRGTPLARLHAMNPRAPIWQELDPDASRNVHASGIAGFPWIPQRLGDANALLIGDAAGYVEPFSGHGIEQALLSASCAVNAIRVGGDVLARFTDDMRVHRRALRRTRVLGAVLRIKFLHFLASMRPMIPETILSRCVERVHLAGVS